MGRYTPDPKVFGIPLFEKYIKTTPEFETMAPSTNGDVLLQYLSAAFLLGERVAESVPSRVVYVDTKEGATPCVVLASNKDHAASFGTEEGRETLKKVYEIIRLEQPPAWYRFHHLLDNNYCINYVLALFIIMIYEIAICFDPKVFGIPLLEEYIKTTPEYEMMGPHTNNVVVQYATAAFMLGEKVAESVPSRVIYVETKEGPAPCVVLASDKDHAASFETEQGRETLKKVYEIIRLEQPPAWYRCS
ncbi:hypothetical protein EV368DRAFT_70423 [Lentinula lateritia]|nr:hypothetical protein EV368DRAFT_70423 [Lentinula lateritia]